MMLSIFTDRFHLAYHHETRTLPQYLLVSAKGGPKLEEVKPGESGKPGTGYMSAGATKMVATGVEIPMLARMLSQHLGHPVVDKTGLTGKYSFRLHWAPEPYEGAPTHDSGPEAASATGDTGVSIFTAVQEQLGLKLEPEKGRVDVIVIDHIEQPAAN
jgi:uncharacterized protein (TIGR03435 family)